MERLKWQTKFRTLTYFGLVAEGGQVAGVLSVRTSMCPYGVFLILIASATIRVYPPVAIGASLLSVVPSASQNVTTLGIDFISFVSKYQNGWVNTGIACSFILFQDEYLVVCIFTLSVRPSCQSSYTISLFIGLPVPLICLISIPFSKSSRVFRQTTQ